MNKKNTASIVVDIVILVLSIAFCVGIKFVFHACGPKEDGSWMACHWAEQAVFAVSISIAVMALIRVIIKDRRIKIGIALSIIPASIMAAVIPGNMINLCMMKDMHCHSVMHPAVVICSVIIAIAAIAGIIADRKSMEEK